MSKTLYVPASIHEKIATFVMGYKFEVCMEGTIKALNTGNYILTDVFPIPQLNSGAFVQSDDERYPEFRAKLIMDKGVEYNKTIRCWIHSHPGMSVNPSGHDSSQFTSRDCASVDDFYIMLITNQKGEYFVRFGEWENVLGVKKLIETEGEVQIVYQKNEEFLKLASTFVKEEKRTVSKTNTLPPRYTGAKVSNTVMPVNHNNKNSKVKTFESRNELKPKILFERDTLLDITDLECYACFNTNIIDDDEPDQSADTILDDLEGVVRRYHTTKNKTEITKLLKAPIQVTFPFGEFVFKLEKAGKEAYKFIEIKE